MRNNLIWALAAALVSAVAPAQAAAPVAERAEVARLRALCLETAADPDRVAALAVARGWKDVTPTLGQDFLAQNPGVRAFRGDGVGEYVMFGDIPVDGFVNHMCGVVTDDPATPYPEKLQAMEAFLGARSIQAGGKARWVWTESDGTRRFLDDVGVVALRAAARERGAAIGVFMDDYAISYFRTTPAAR